MANAKKCDRCGSLYEAYVPKGAHGFNHIRIFKDLSGRIDRIQCFDLCPVCSDYLRSRIFVEGRPNEQQK